MSSKRRALVLALSQLGLLALLTLLQTAAAAPQRGADPKAAALVQAAPVQAGAERAPSGPENEFTDAITLPMDRTAIMTATTGWTRATPNRSRVSCGICTANSVSPTECDLVLAIATDPPLRLPRASGGS